MAWGARFASLISPPPAAARPRLTSGIPKTACSAATTRSHASTISKPPASAAPLTAATSGFGNLREAIPANPPFGDKMSPISPAAKAFRSMPAQNARSPVPVSTTTQTSGSSVISSKAAPSARVVAPSIALRAPSRFSRTSSTWPCRSRTTGSPALLGRSVGSDMVVPLVGRSPCSRQASLHSASVSTEALTRFCPESVRLPRAGVAAPYRGYIRRSGGGYEVTQS